MLDVSGTCLQLRVFMASKTARALGMSVLISYIGGLRTALRYVTISNRGCE